MSLFFVEPVIRRLDGGRLFREIVSAALKGAGGLAVLASLWQFFKLFDLYAYLSFGEKVAYFVFANLLTLAAALLVFQVLWVRSRDIRGDEGGGYPAIAIFGHLARAGGESYAILVSVSGLSTMVLAWLKLYPSRLANYLPDLGLRADEPFWAGSLALVSALIAAATALLAAYLAAELVTALADIARQTRGGQPADAKNRLPGD